MMSENAKPVVNVDDLDLNDFGHGEKFGAKLGQIGALIGAEAMGCMLIVVEPGKAAFPFHVHHANEEMFVILEGSGEYRFGEAVHDIRAGDVLAAPAGGPDVAHQITNTGSSTMKYLGLSTKIGPESGRVSRFRQIRRDVAIRPIEAGLRRHSLYRPPGQRPRLLGRRRRRGHAGGRKQGLRRNFDHA